MRSFVMYALLTITVAACILFSISCRRYFGSRTPFMAIGFFVFVSPWQSSVLVSNIFCSPIDVSLWIESAPFVGSATCSLGKALQWVLTTVGLSCIAISAYPYLRRW